MPEIVQEVCYTIKTDVAPRRANVRGRGTNRSERFMQGQSITGYGLCECGCGEKTPIATQAIKHRGLKKGDHHRFVAGHYPRVRPTRPIVERFWEKVEKGPDCWLWTGTITRCGYGQLGAGKRGKFVRVHRLSYELTYGTIPPGMLVCHSCDVRTCVNPEHLFLGTAEDNTQDARRKNRVRQDPTTGRFVPMEKA